MPVDIGVAMGYVATIFIVFLFGLLGSKLTERVHGIIVFQLFMVMISFMLIPHFFGFGGEVVLWYMLSWIITVSLGGLAMILWKTTVAIYIIESASLFVMYVLFSGAFGIIR